mgnify:CR=1 FL=1
MKLKVFFALLLITLSINSFSNSSNIDSRYPQPHDDYVNDFAGIINDIDRKKIRSLLDSLEYESGIEATLVTIDSIHDYPTNDHSIESFSTRLFNDWGIGNREENNGILLVIAVTDRKTRIELGSGYGHYYDSDMKYIIDNEMIPYFKVNKYSQGAHLGLKAIIDKVTVKVTWFDFYKFHILGAILAIFCILAGVSCMRSGKTGWGWAFFTIAGVIIFFLVKTFLNGNRSNGFGGGGSFGGGASGSW